MRQTLLVWAICVTEVVAAWLVTGERQSALAGPPIYVTNNLTNDRPGGRLVELDGSTGQYEGLVGSLTTPRGIVIGPNGNLFVASGNQVLEYSFQNGLQPTTFVTPSAGGLQSAHGLTFGPDGNLYVTTFRQDLIVYRYDGETGAYLNRFATYPLEPGWGQDIVFGPDGDLYVTTLFLGVFRFDGASGAPLGKFAYNAALGNISGITFGPDGNLYAAASEADVVARFHGVTGQFIDTFVPAGAGGLNAPQGIRFGPDGNLYVASAFSDAILRYDGTSGAFIDKFASTGLDVPFFFVFVPEPNCLWLSVLGACGYFSFTFRARRQIV